MRKTPATLYPAHMRFNPRYGGANLMEPEKRRRRTSARAGAGNHANQCLRDMRRPLFTTGSDIEEQFDIAPDPTRYTNAWMSQTESHLAKRCSHSISTTEAAHQERLSGHPSLISSQPKPHSRITWSWTAKENTAHAAGDMV